MIGKLMLFALILVVILGIAGCKPNPIVGYWVGFRDGEMFRLTFNADLTVSSDTRWGTYKCADGKLTLRWMTGASETVPYSISGGGENEPGFMTFFPDDDDAIRFMKSGM